MGGGKDLMRIAQVRGANQYLGSLEGPRRSPLGYVCSQLAKLRGNLA